MALLVPGGCVSFGLRQRDLAGEVMTRCCHQLPMTKALSVCLIQLCFCLTQASTQKQLPSGTGSEMCSTPWGTQPLQVLPPLASKEEMLYPTYLVGKLRQTWPTCLPDNRLRGTRLVSGSELA